MSTRTWLSTDYYATLGVARDASDVEIARVFRAQAKRLHPDTTSSLAESERFKELAAAYAVLGNAARRAGYDAARRAASGPATGAAPRTAAATRVVAEPDAHRPLSVRFLADRRRAAWALGAGIGLGLAGIVAAGLILWLQASERAERRGTVATTAERVRTPTGPGVRFRSTTGRTVVAADPDAGSGAAPGTRVDIRYGRADPSRVSTDEETTPRDITFWLVAAKLVVIGIAFAVLGTRRRRYP